MTNEETEQQQRPPSGSTVRKPSGVFEIQRGFTNAAPTGVVFQTNTNFPGWGQIESKEGIYDWSGVDTQINAKPANKFMGCNVAMLCSPPSWLHDKYGVQVYQVPHGQNKPVAWVKPWDPLVQPKLLSFIKALCLHIDGKVDYVVLDGVGEVTETYIPDLSVIGETASAALAHWQQSTPKVIDTYAANLKSSPFIIAAAPPLQSNKSATDALDSIVRSKADQYPLFGVANYGLTANSDYKNGFVPFVLIHDLGAKGHLVGFQFSTNWANIGTLQQTFDAAVANGAKYVEAWSGPIEDPANASIVTNANKQLLANSTAPVKAEAGSTAPREARVVDMITC